MSTRTRARRTAAQQSRSHPGAVPKVDDDVLAQMWARYYASVDKDSDIFELGKYKDHGRSKQICASGLLQNRQLLLAMNEPGTNFRYLPTQLEKSLIANGTFKETEDFNGNTCYIKVTDETEMARKRTTRVSGQRHLHFS